jgi:hypothetical protein
MSTISSANFVIEMRRVAHAIQLIQTALGDGDDTNTPGKGGANALAAVLALAETEQLNALLAPAQRLADAAKYGGYYYGAWYDYMRAIDAHVNDINDFCLDNALHIHYLCKAVFPAIAARYVFPPVTDFGTMTASGSGAGTWAADSTVDTDLYGDALVEVVTESVIGAASITATITGTDYDSNASQVTCTITNGTSNATTVAVIGSDRFAAITTVTFTGGTASDKFRVQTKLDHSAAGCA